MKNFLDFFKKQISKEDIAKLLNTTPEALIAFEQAYSAISDDENKESGDFFKINSRDAAKLSDTHENTPDLDSIKTRIVNELLAESDIIPAVPDNNLVTNSEIMSVPEDMRPQLTGTLIKKDITEADSYWILINQLMQYKKTGKKQFYHMFRQGLDVLDLDPVTYDMIGTNPNSMGFWFPVLESAVNNQDFFKIPETKIRKVPLPILQLTRLDYFSLTHGQNRHLTLMKTRLILSKRAHIRQNLISETQKSQRLKKCVR